MTKTAHSTTNSKLYFLKVYTVNSTYLEMKFFFSILGTNCNCDNMGSMADIIVKQSARSLAKTALQIIKERKVILDKKWSCSTTSTNNQTAKEFENRLQQELSQSSRYVMLKDKYDIPYLQPPIEMTVKLENQRLVNNGSVKN